MAGKIRSYPIKKIPVKRVQVQVPTEWLKDMNFDIDDSIDLLRDEKNRLILVANKKRERILCR